LAEAPSGWRPWRFEGNAATRKHLMVKQKYFKGGNERLEGERFGGG